MKVYWTDTARAGLHGIEQMIARDSPMVAPRIVQRILLHSRRIGLLPYSGRSVPEYEQDDVREILLRPYRIIYRVNTEKIEVLTIRHYRELLPEDLASL